MEITQREEILRQREEQLLSKKELLCKLQSIAPMSQTWRTIKVNNFDISGSEKFSTFWLQIRAQDGKIRQKTHLGSFSPPAVESAKILIKIIDIFGYRVPIGRVGITSKRILAAWKIVQFFQTAFSDVIMAILIRPFDADFRKVT